MSKRSSIVTFQSSYVCQSGAKYKYFGRCVRAESRWEAVLYHHDKEFKNDSWLNSPDLLKNLSDLLVTASNLLDDDNLRELAISEAEKQIEAWDKSNGHGK